MFIHMKLWITVQLWITILLIAIIAWITSVILLMPTISSYDDRIASKNYDYTIQEIVYVESLDTFFWLGTIQGEQIKISLSDDTKTNWLKTGMYRIEIKVEYDMLTQQVRYFPLFYISPIKQKVKIQKIKDIGR
jgi:hypothetical protein